MPNAGQLRHQIRIETIPTVKSSTGAEIPGAAVTFTTVNGDIETLGGKESFSADRDNAELTHKWTIRYVAGVVPTMRIYWIEFARVFDIVSVEHVRGRKRWMFLKCREYRTSATP
jgi:SPP1 family predicted phage head-tail adaptor